MKKRYCKPITHIILSVLFFLQYAHEAHAERAIDYQAVPPFVTNQAPPLVMLVMARNHKLYYEAYNDATDLDGDGSIDVGYRGEGEPFQDTNGNGTWNQGETFTDMNGDGRWNPGIDYYGYFDSHKCYVYDTGQERFEPRRITTDKKCTGTDEWSGDFLNYLTMSRMDTMRKVLYGGYRSTDNVDETVLERVYIPQDAHSWGKEYGSIAEAGYDIRDYTPLDLPMDRTRHLFASTTLSENGTPILRVLPNSPLRIWDWVAKQNPVCDDTVDLLVHPHPLSHEIYSALVEYFAVEENMQGSQPVANINGSGNPFGADSGYLTIFSGNFLAGVDENYRFFVEGSDSVELLIDGQEVIGWYGEHAACPTGSPEEHDACLETHGQWIALEAGSHSIEFRHETDSGGQYTLWWQSADSHWEWEIMPAAVFRNLTQTVYGFNPASLNSTITDYASRVVVCEPDMLEGNCQKYSNGGYKPIGLLQQYGETERMYFGLLTGSYAKNKSGGVLRKKIGTITDEISLDTGIFTDEGIISTINKLRTVNFTYDEVDPWEEDTHWYTDCSWRTDRTFIDGECSMWGNPVAEMMYEGLRYFSGAGNPTSAFTYGDDASLPDNQLQLPLDEEWSDPYSKFERCAKPYMLVLSDINPTFDSDQLPGSAFPSSSSSGGLTDFHAANLAARISSLEQGVSGSHFIGETLAADDGICTEKNINNLGEIRGICPEEPTKEGSYYAASVAYYGLTHDINPADDAQHVSTMVVALASPLPKVDITVGEATVTLVPTAKTVDGNCGDNLPPGVNLSVGSDYHPTDAIADFFIEEMGPAHGRFRINFEDLEQGGDFDQDAIVEYEYQVLDAHGDAVEDPALGRSVRVTVTSTAASGCLVQHIGYVISGTTADGTYLEVRDFDTSASQDSLPLTAERLFTVDAGQPAATLLKNPLWYAAKWGGFEENDGEEDAIPAPDDPTEWDKDGDGTPDNYFYVSNPLHLSEQLNNSFAEILKRVASGSAAAVVSSSRTGEGAVYQSIFYSQYADTHGNAVDWAGDVRALFVDAYGNIREDTNGNQRLDVPERRNSGCENEGDAEQYDKIIIFNGTEVEKYIDADCDMVPEADERDPSGSLPLEEAGIAYVWTASDWLNSPTLDAVHQREYTHLTNQRYIFTFVDQDGDMVVDGGEQQAFVRGTGDAESGGDLPAVEELTDTSKVFPYLTLFPTYPSFSDEPAWVRRLSSGDIRNEFLQKQTNRVIDYIRGEDQEDLTIGGFCFVPAMRSRRYGPDADGDGRPDITWRLGDIVHSSPTVVGRPSEGYHLLYKDDSYGRFARKYHNRRSVVYVGANDGMVHAFNAGFYDSANRAFRTSPTDADEIEFALGQELWAYIPYNLLPHLYWLTETDYPHIYYNDLKPKVFDARIFADDDDHPGGWGTVMVTGMRFGGGRIRADLDNNGIYDDKTDRTMGSAYTIFDITNPETPPRVLAELSFPGLGYTTCYPAVIPMLSREKNEDTGQGDGIGTGDGDSGESQGAAGADSGNGQLYTFGSNEWFLVFGSGPADENGNPASHPDTGDSGGVDILGRAVSMQSAKLFVVDLKKLGMENSLQIVRHGETGAPVFADYDRYGINYIKALDEKSFISDPVAVDYDKDFNVDAVYFGTVSGSEGEWGGKLRRLITADSPDPASWLADSILLDAGKPITAAPTIALDKKGNRWIYFGTGRFLVRNDAENSDEQCFYGVKEPIVGDDDGTPSWQEVAENSLLDVTSAEVRRDRTVHNLDDIDITDWSSLIKKMDEKTGWKYRFAVESGKPSERNLGQAALLGRLLTFTTYTPSEDLCAMEGESTLYALYYKTGTSYFRTVLRENPDEESGGGESGEEDGDEVIQHSVSLGQGLTITPALHTGRQEGSKAFVQTSTGGIKTIQQENPGVTKSGKHTWRVRK